MEAKNEKQLAKTRLAKAGKQGKGGNADATQSD